MQFSTALDRTLKQYKISLTWLAEQSGVSRQMISSFVNGHQRVYSDSLEKIVSSLPLDAREFFFQQFGFSATDWSSVLEDMDSVEHWNALVDELDSAKLAQLMIAIGNRLQRASFSEHLMSA